MHGCGVRGCLAVTYSAVQTDVNELKNGVNYVENELKSHADPKPGDNFKSVMTISARPGRPDGWVRSLAAGWMGVGTT